MAGIATVRELEQSGVGISLSLDLLISGCQEEWIKVSGMSRQVDVIVCSLGHHLRTKEKIDLLKRFWSHGISSSAIDNSEACVVTNQNDLWYRMQTVFFVLF